MPRETSPVGLTLSFAPYYRRVDAATGEQFEHASLPLTLLVDREIVPRKWLAAVNLTYNPTFSRATNPWTTEHFIELSVATAYALTDRIFLGGEFRRDESCQIGRYPAHALFVGPSLFWKFRDDMSVKVAWSAQVRDFGSNRLNVSNYERHQVLLLLVKSF